ncbi:hypothetical protein ACFFJX_10760 [Pseudarcicella hirudinis]|uniref:hypothetical protein n=1 Tax=Pseudarcicella hirudinis TaxID=1079859 RepID=UPI0035E4C3B4
MNAQNLETVQETEYDNIYFQIRKVKTIDSYSNKITSSNGGITYDRYIETTYKYPFDFPVDNSVMNGMTNANMISTVIEEIKELVVLNAPRKLLSHTKTTYQFVNGTYLPKMIETKLGDAQDFDKKIDFLEYDTKGNLTKYWERNGIVTQLEYFGNSDIGKVNLLNLKRLVLEVLHLKRLHMNINHWLAFRQLPIQIADLLIMFMIHLVD